MRNAFLYQVSTILPLTDFISQISLTPTTLPLSYEAGQYVTVLQQDKTASPLSIACAPNAEAHLQFHLFHTVSANELLRMARDEKYWQLQGPFGNAVASRLSLDKPIIFLARGTGFAPIKAVIETLIKQRRYPPIYFYWSMRTEKDFYLKDLLRQWEKELKDFIFKPVYTQETGSHVLPNIILQDHADLSNYQVYASGPRPLVHTAYADFLKCGLQKESFYSDVI